MAAVAENGIARPEDHRENNYDRDVRELVDLLSKLNPSAKEFVPSSKSNGRLSADAPVFVASSPDYYNNLFDGGFNYFKGFDGSPVVNYNQQQQQHRRVWNLIFLIADRDNSLFFLLN